MLPYPPGDCITEIHSSLVFPSAERVFVSLSKCLFTTKKQTATFNERQKAQIKNVLGTVHKGGGQKRDKCLNHSE